MASLMASKTLLLPTPNPTFRAHHNQPLSTLSLPFRKPLAFSLHKSKPYSSFNPILKPTIVASSSSSSSCSSPTLPNNQSSNPTNPTYSPLFDSTRTISTILALAVSFSGAFIKLITKFSLKIKENVPTPNPDELAVIQNLQKNLVCTVGPLFFASLRDRPIGYLNTPLTVVAAGLSKWLDIYSGVLMIGVLLSWFLNIPWDRQPLSAIRDLCDPYLNLFRNIIPPSLVLMMLAPFWLSPSWTHSVRFLITAGERIDEEEDAPLIEQSCRCRTFFVVANWRHWYSRQLVYARGIASVFCMMLRDLCLPEEVSMVDAPTVYCKKLKSADFVTDGMHQKCGTSS